MVKDFDNSAYEKGINEDLIGVYRRPPFRHLPTPEEVDHTYSESIPTRVDDEEKLRKWIKMFGIVCLNQEKWTAQIR